MNQHKNALNRDGTSSGHTVGTIEEPAYIGGTSGNASPRPLRQSDQEKCILEELEYIIDEYRRGRRDKVDTITNIVDTVGESTLDAKFRSDCIEHNIAVLNSIKKESHMQQKRAEGRKAAERERDWVNQRGEDNPLGSNNERTNSTDQGKRIK
ncbi:hypothetical protein C0992_009453 [Termitomyces sp. T32_za158]|nr:hypothetical protein C0992_009453 [Termitomyces sp. T32_za158]